MKRPALQPAAGDREVGAEAVGARAVLGVGDPRRGVMVELGRIVAAQRRHDAGEDDRQAVAARVDDARLAQRRQQLGAALDRVLAGVDRALERRGDRRVLLARLGGRARGAGSPGCGRRRSRSCGPSRGPPSGSSPRPDRARRSRRGRRRSRAPRRSGSRRSAGPAGDTSSSAAPRISCERITPELPRAPSSAARATDCTISSRPISSIVRCSSAPCRRSSSSSTARSVSAMLSPVSPSATGNTLRSLTSSRRDSRCASAPATATETDQIGIGHAARLSPSARSSLVHGDTR